MAVSTSYPFWDTANQYMMDYAEVLRKADFLEKAPDALEYWLVCSDWTGGWHRVAQAVKQEQDRRKCLKLS